jgi:hypothetical protein
MLPADATAAVMRNNESPDVQMAAAIGRELGRKAKDALNNPRVLEALAIRLIRMGLAGATRRCVHRHGLCRRGQVQTGVADVHG